MSLLSLLNGGYRYQSLTVNQHSAPSPHPFFMIIESLDERSLTYLEQVCKRISTLIPKNTIWADYLTERNIPLIPKSSAKAQVITHIRGYCRFLLSTKIVVIAEELNGLNVFDAKLKLELGVDHKVLCAAEKIFLVPKKDLEKSVSQLIRQISDLRYQFLTEPGSDAKIRIEYLEAELRMYLDRDVAVEKNFWYPLLGVVSEATLMCLFKKIRYFKADEIDIVISNNYSSDVIKFMFKNVECCSTEKAQNMLLTALSKRLDEPVISSMLALVCCTPDHLLSAICRGYSEPLITEMCRSLSFRDMEPSISKEVLKGLFYEHTNGRISLRKECAYSQKLIRNILIRITKIDVIFLLYALKLKFSKKTLEIMILKVDKVTRDEINEAIKSKIPEILLWNMIEKLSFPYPDPLTTGFCEGYSEGVLHMLVQYGAPVDEEVLKQAIVKNYTENLIEQIILRLYAVTQYVITLAKDKNYSEKLISLLEKKLEQKQS